MDSTSKPKVLLVEDDALIREIMNTSLVKEGYTVFPAANVQEFLDKLQTARADIILLDLMLPDGNGLNLLKTIREHTAVPVIILSSNDDLVDKVVGLEMGADDYMGKPVQIKELTARIRAQIRRYQFLQGEQKEPEQTKKNSKPRISFGPWVLDRSQFQAYDAAGKSANLTVMEFQLLDALVTSPNQVFSREHLLDKVRTNDYNVTDRAIDIQIMRIRRKVSDKAGPNEMIRSIRGVGYMFVAETKILP